MDAAQTTASRRRLIFSGCGLFMAFALSCPPFISSAATYYVNPETGNDSNAGTVDAPFKTVNKGFSFINESDNRGSELIIAPGKYQLTSAIGCNGGGSEAKRSHVRSSTGKPEDVVIYSDGTFECLRLGSFITISGITFSNGVNSATCPSGGIRFWTGEGYCGFCSESGRYWRKNMKQATIAKAVGIV